MTVRDRDRGGKALARGVRELEDEIVLSIGVHADVGAQAHPSGPSIAEVATVVEFGAEDRAASGFLRRSVDAARAELERGLANAAEGALRGRSSAGAGAQRVAEQAAELVREQAPRDTGTLAGAIEARRRS